MNTANLPPLTFDQAVYLSLGLSAFLFICILLLYLILFKCRCKQSEAQKKYRNWYVYQYPLLCYRPLGSKLTRDITHHQVHTQQKGDGEISKRG